MATAMDAPRVAAGRQSRNRAEEGPEKVLIPEQEDIVVFASVIDILFLLLLKVEVEFALESLEMLGAAVPSTYVTGLHKERWFWVEIQTAVRGRRLPRGSCCLQYGGFPTTSPLDDADECFLLASLLEVIHDLLQRRDIELSMKLLENLSVQAPLATVVNLPKEVWMDLKRRVTEQSPELRRPAMLALGNLRRRTTHHQDDEGHEDLSGRSSITCEAGLDRAPSNCISTRVVPPDAFLVAPGLKRQG
eukprot:TRINITY_DN6557_c0_g2_i5.p1 TRINITY_DN6557_c0_g2~~TRINITY_DN6557_c0_g2_i5.p1  ORF type:complete len:247 (+),score=37.87 TRINITY_DN6557_c0_g2_i5:124-864(+)